MASRSVKHHGLITLAARFVRAASATLLLVSVSCKASDDAPLAAGPASAEAFTIPEVQRDRIHVAAVEAAPFHRTVTTPGTVAFIQNASTHVVSAISGTVTEILVPLGTNVKAGTPLAKVASPDFAAAVSNYRKAAIVAQNLHKIADADKNLLTNGNIGRRELEQAQADALSADADREAAAEQLRALGTPAGEMGSMLGGSGGANAVIRSPMDGTVVELGINPGQLLEAGGTDAFTIADLSRMWVMAEVFESDLPFVKVGDPARIVTGTSTKPIAGKVDYVSDIVDPSTRAVAVRIVADNPDRALKKDAFVNVSLESSTEERGMLVPAAAILLDSESLPYVFVQSDDKSYARRRVTIGLRTGDQIEIVEGLKAKELVVSEGALFLQFAQTQ